MKQEQNVDLAALLAGAPAPDWIREMRRHYQETGTYRPEDVRRVLGDPNRESELQKRLSDDPEKR